MVAPKPVRVTLVPTQMEVEEATADTVGEFDTTKVTIAVFEQPLAVPVTVYTPDVVGEKGIPLVTPPVQAYVVAPPPVKVTWLPAHTFVEVALAVTEGRLLTVTVTTAVLEQEPAVPVTV